MRSTSPEKINKLVRIIFLFLSIFFYYLIFHYDYHYGESLIDHFFYAQFLEAFDSAGSYNLTKLADERWSKIFDVFLSLLYFFMVWKYRVRLSEMVSNFWKKLIF
tara:strand:- start:1007 stop:1321 length:315 start_codon:yes stop_codon:yes gene_type:complete